MMVKLEMVKDHPVLSDESLKAVESAVCPRCGKPLALTEGFGWDTSRLYCIAGAGGCGFEDVLAGTCSDCKGAGCEECDYGIVEVTTYPVEFTEELS